MAVLPDMFVYRLEGDEHISKMHSSCEGWMVFFFQESDWMFAGFAEDETAEFIYKSAAEVYLEAPRDVKSEAT